jgi:hypothetical protein
MIIIYKIFIRGHSYRIHVRENNARQTRAIRVHTHRNCTEPMMNRCTSYFFLRIRIPYSFFPGTIRHCGHILVMTQGVINHGLELVKTRQTFNRASIFCSGEKFNVSNKLLGVVYSVLETEFSHLLCSRQGFGFCLLRKCRPRMS